MTRLEHEDVIPHVHGVDKGSLPGCRARGRVDDHRTLGSEQRPYALEELERQGLKLRAAVIDGGKVDGPQDAIWHV